MVPQYPEALARQHIDELLTRAGWVVVDIGEAAAADQADLVFLDPSLLTYQNFPRKPRNAFVRDTARSMHGRMPGSEVTVLPTPDVTFFLAGQPRHRAVLDAGSRRVSATWQGQINVSSHGNP